MAVKAKAQITLFDMTDAYSVILTSETFTFAGNTSGAPSGLSCSTQAVAYCGGTQCKKLTIGTVSCPTGISATVSNNGTASPTITFKTTATVAASCEATIPVTVDDVTINKKFSFAVAKTGATGAAGKGIKSTAVTYQLSSSSTTAPTGTWTSSVPAADASKPYLWTKTVMTYTDGTTSTGYSVGSTQEAWKYDSDAMKKGNLIINGDGSAGTNYNFSWWSLSGEELYENLPCFSYAGKSSARLISDTIIPVDIARTYQFDMNLKTSEREALYLGAVEYDIDRRRILPEYVMRMRNSSTTLAKELKNGDTVVYFTSLDTWTIDSSSPSHHRGLTFWDYKDSTGRLYKEGEYTRHAWLDLYTYDKVDKESKTITLKKAWSCGTFAAGTKVSQSNSSGYKYFDYIGNAGPTEWAHTSCTFRGLADPYSWVTGKFSAATKYIQFIMLCNYNNTKTDITTLINNVSLNDITDTEDLNNKLTQFREETASNIDQTAEAIKSTVYDNVYLKGDVDTLISSVNTEVTQTKDSWQVTFNQFQQTLNDVTDSTDAQFDEIKKYIRFEDGNILLGNNESPLILKLRNDRIQFLQNGYEVAYISDQRMYNTVCEIIKQLKIADSAWTVETNSAGDTIVSLIGI